MFKLSEKKTFFETRIAENKSHKLDKNITKIGKNALGEKYV